MSDGEASSLLTPAGAFEFLLGTWRLERAVSGLAVMAGTLRVTRTKAGTADYEERVRVTTADGATLMGSQRYRMRETEDGVGLCFAETGAMFQKLRFAYGIDARLSAEAVHVCGEDRYETVYVLGPGRGFSVRHTVRGPRKDYISVTWCDGLG